MRERGAMIIVSVLLTYEMIYNVDDLFVKDLATFYNNNVS